MRRGGSIIVPTLRDLRRVIASRIYPEGAERLIQKTRQHARADVWHVNRHGELLWAGLGLPNLWHDEGEQQLLYPQFATTNTAWQVESNLYLGLDARGAPAEADTLASLSGEPSGNGYARQVIPTNGDGTGDPWTVSQPGAYYQAKSSDETFTASGGAWSAVTQLFLCTHLTATATGDGQRLLCTLALTASRTLQDGDSLITNITIGISE